MEKPKIIYVYDPMCGWCYGFSPVIKEIENEYKQKFNFEIISGGMVVGDREGPIGGFADYILSAYKRVESTTGIKFGEPYLELLKKKDYFSSSVKPSIALSYIKDIKPEIAISFAHDMQKRFYFDGKLLHENESYLPLLEKYQINKEDFFKAIESDVYKAKANEDFNTSKKLGVTGFPCVIVFKDGKYQFIASGYTSKKELLKALDKI
ncbi:MAG: DsbA family protein [Bacteroidia bacterium]